MAQNLDLRCVLISDPSTLGAGAKTRLHTPQAVTYHEQPHCCRFMIGHSLGRMESKIKKFTPHCICRPHVMIEDGYMTYSRGEDTQCYRTRGSENTGGKCGKCSKSVLPHRVGAPSPSVPPAPCSLLRTPMLCTCDKVITNKMGFKRYLLQTLDSIRPRL